MTVGDLYTFLMVFFRGLGVVMLLPALGGERTIPPMIKVAIAFCLAVLVSGLVPTGRLPESTRNTRTAPRISSSSQRERQRATICGAAP